MKFSKVNAVRIPNGNAVRIRHGGKTMRTPIGARYVSFGDSIAAGHAINDDWEKNYGTGSQYGNNGRTETALVPNCYTELIHRDLTRTPRSTVTSYSETYLLPRLTCQLCRPILNNGRGISPAVRRFAKKYLAD